MGVESDFKDVLDQIGKEHTVGISAHKKKAKNVNSLPEATNISSHVEEWVNHSFIFYHSIVQAKLGLKVGVRIDRS